MLVEKHVKVKLHTGQVLEGQVYTVDKMRNLLVLECGAGAFQTVLTSNTPVSSSRPKKALSFINVSNISQIEVVPTKDATPSLFPLQQIDFNRLKATRENRLSEHKQKISRVGVGVPLEAQEIFNALSKTFDSLFLIPYSLFFILYSLFFPLYFNNFS